MHGQDRVEWGVAEQILADIANSTAWHVWMDSADGAKNRNRPVPILPPWVEDQNREQRHFGGAPVPLAELHDFLGWEQELST